MPIEQMDIADIESLIKKLTIQSHHGFENFTDSVNLPNALVLDIDNVATLQQVMKAIYQLNQTKSSKERIIVRTAAGGREDISESHSYSFSPCTEADIILRLTGKEFLQIENLSINQDKRVKVGPSLQIGELDKKLYEEHDLTLPTSSLIPYVTVAGLASNSGHGTGQTQPGFSGLIEAITYCLPNGEIVRIDRHHPHFETIRAADLGLFGVVLNYELRCIPAQKLQCVMETRSVPAFLNEIKNGLFKNDPYVSAMYVPGYYADEATNNKRDQVLIFRWRPVDKAVENVNHHETISKSGQKFEMFFNNHLPVTQLLAGFPEIIPAYMRYFVSLISVGDHDKIEIGPWHEMAHYQIAFPTSLDEIEVLFETQDEPKNGVHHPEIIIALEKILKTLAQSAKKGEYPMTYALYMRYLQGTQHGLSVTQHNDKHHICAIDMTFRPTISGVQKFKQTMQDFFLNKMHGKLHWGKNIAAVDYEKIYGVHFNEFMTALTHWHQEHHLELAKNPHLNETFCKVLKLPYMPAPVQHQPFTNPETTPVNTQLEDWIKSINQNSKEGKELVKAIRKCLEEKVETCSCWPNFFKKRTGITATQQTQLNQHLDPLSHPRHN